MAERKRTREQKEGTEFQLDTGGKGNTKKKRMISNKSSDDKKDRPQKSTGDSADGTPRNNKDT